MKISVVGLTSDSSDNEDVDRKNVNGSEDICAKSLTLQHFSTESKKQFDAERKKPLFKVRFKDESTSRTYRKSLEDIMNYLVSTKPGEDSELDADQGLVLEIFEPNEKFDTKTSGTTSESSEPHVVDCNNNRNVTFNIEKAINMVPISKNDVNSKTNHILTTKSLNQTIQSVRYFGVSNYEIQHYSKPQQVQQPIFQQQFSILEKRKWMDGSDFTVLRKKQRVHFASEHVSNCHNTPNMLKNSETDEVNLPYFDPVWYKVNGRQTVVATEDINNAEFKASTSYDSTLHNSCNEPATESESLERTKSSQVQVTSTDSTTLRDIRDTCCQAQANRSLTSKEKSISTFTYRVLKVGTLDYTAKRTFSLSKDGIQFFAHHLRKVSTIVKVDIKFVNIVTIEASFSQFLPALFLYINDRAATNVRETLGFNNDSNAYLDPWSTDENCNKIIILPDHMSAKCRVIKNLIKLGLINKLNKKSADYILRNSFSKTLGRQSIQNNQLGNRNKVNIRAQIVRIGTYNCSKIKFDVMVSTEGFQFQIPKVEDDEIYRQITIYFAEIEKLYFSTSKVSAFLLHVNWNCAQRIRSLIEMSETNKKKVYFEPSSENIAEQRLVIIFNKIQPHQQETLKNLLSHTQSAEIYLDKIIHQMLFNHM